MLKSIKIVLCQPSHPGNIGAAARALKTMGLKKLVLVAPERFLSQEALERSAGAEDVLREAQIMPTLWEAVSDCEVIFGTSTRIRQVPWPLLSARACAAKIMDYPNPAKIAIVFGTERSGLTTEELSLCHYHVTIPANPEYEALNLSQAVQVVCYEVYQAYLERQEKPETMPLTEQASLEDVMGVFDHLLEVLSRTEFIDPKPTRMLILRLKRLLFKARLETEEVNILRGIFKAILQKLPQV